ncbi:MAG: hypothetical protein V1827_00750 [Candidatus Micrarchaeota archaeon]
MRYVPLVLALLLIGSSYAYHCLFGGSAYYPQENYAYCAKNDPSGMPNMGCYDMYSFYADCMRDCCKANGGSMEIWGGTGKGDAAYDTEDSSYFYSDCEGKGQCVMTGFNAACMYPGEYSDLGILTGYKTIDKGKLDRCVLDCASSDIPGQDNSGGFHLNKVPISLRECACRFMEERWDEVGEGCEPYLGGAPTGGTPPEEIPGDEDGVCAGVDCGNLCAVSGGRGILSHDGACFETASNDKGYECRYASSECEWGCDASMGSCAASPVVDISISEPADGTRFDPGNADSARITVRGTTIKSGTYGIPKVYVFVGSNGMVEADYDYSTGSFSLSGVEIKRGRPVDITAAVYSQDGRKLGSDSVTVYTSPEVLRLSMYPEAGVTVFIDGVQLSTEEAMVERKMKEGQEYLISGNGIFTIEYTDGTKVYLKAPAKASVYKDGLHVLYGGVEIDVEHDYEVLARQGHYINEGTKFAIIVPESDDGAETLIVTEGTVLAGARGSDGMVEVHSGEKLVLYPNTAAIEDSVQKATDQDYAMTPSGEGPSSCLGFILVGAVLASLVLARR